MADTAIACVVGLGNPGPRYEQTRHNVGFWLIDELARHYGVALRADSKFAGEVGRMRSQAGECWLLKPDTFMNHSGRSVAALTRFYRIPPEQVLVIHDELDMAPGMLRIKKGGGHGGHNGLRDIVNAIGSRDFLRVRIGIGHPGHKSGVSDYVLSRPSADDQRLIEASMDVLLQHWQVLQRGDLQQAMQLVHSAT